MMASKVCSSPYADITPSARSFFLSISKAKACFPLSPFSSHFRVLIGVSDLVSKDSIKFHEEESKYDALTARVSINYHTFKRAYKSQKTDPRLGLYYDMG